jgi:hypothetical protein
MKEFFGVADAGPGRVVDACIMGLTERAINERGYADAIPVVVANMTFVCNDLETGYVPEDPESVKEFLTALGVSPNVRTVPDKDRKAASSVFRAAASETQILVVCPAKAYVCGRGYQEDFMTEGDMFAAACVFRGDEASKTLEFVRGVTESSDEESPLVEFRAPRYVPASRIDALEKVLESIDATPRERAAIIVELLWGPAESAEAYMTALDMQNPEEYFVSELSRV